MESTDLSDPLADELISRLEENAEDLGIMANNEMFSQHNLFGDGEEESEPDDVIVMHMDIRQPLTKLKSLLEKKIGIDLQDYTFWLQDAQRLEPDKNLVDQCVKGEGLVQVNSQIVTLNQRINIVDVLKPTEDALDTIENDDDSQLSQAEEEEDDSNADQKDVTQQQPPAGQKPCLNWFLDNKFRKEQMRLKIPDDPNDWTAAQVKHWLQWAVRQFNLTKIKLSDWNISGQELCSLTHEEFHQKVPLDPRNVFWTHLELLKKCKFVAITHQTNEDDVNSDSNSSLNTQREHRIMRKQLTSQYVAKNYASPGITATPNTMAVGSGNNGQVQLWQFLLDILTDRDYRDIISWVGHEGEFKLTDPERVARLWGERKNKPAMNYEKLSRALRYYYDGDMISKVPAKRFAYKFDCDLKNLIGYNAQELSNLVNERNAPATPEEPIFFDHFSMDSDD